MGNPRMQVSLNRVKLAGTAWVFLAVVWATLLIAWPAWADDGKSIPKGWQVWIDEEVYPLISEEQRRAFLALESEAQRQLFADDLWRLWGNQTESGDRFRMDYEKRLEYCRLNFSSTTEDRARVVLMNGPPDDTLKPRCNRVFVPLDFWYWRYLDGMGKDFVVLFYQPNGVGPWRLWSQHETRRVLYRPSAWTQKLLATSRIEAPELQCFNEDTVMRLLNEAEYWGPSSNALLARRQLSSNEESERESSSSRFLEFSAIVPDDAEPLELTIETTPGEAQGSKTEMGFTVTVARAGLGHSTVGGSEVTQLNLVGEISAGGTMTDRFRYLFTVPNAPELLSLVFDRFLRPGDYSLRISVEDVHSPRAGLREMDFSVPAPTLPLPTANPPRPESTQ